MLRELILLAVTAGLGCAVSTSPDTPMFNDLLTFPDAVRLTNGVVSLDVSPNVGRVTHFGYVGGRNLLWINTADAAGEPIVHAGRSYVNVGGDKLWPSVQYAWPRVFATPDLPDGGVWPPDGVIDGRPWTLVSRSDRSVTMQSAEHPTLGVTVRRTFTLSDADATVWIENRATRTSPSVFPVTNWTVTQVPHPTRVRLGTPADDVAPTLGHPHPFVRLMPNPTREELVVGDHSVEWVLPMEGARPSTHGKLGTLGGWVAGVYDDVTFLQTTPVEPAAAYPDASNAQVYTGPLYAELELLGPTVHLRVGESLTNVVTWRLLRLGQDVGATARDAIGR